MRDISTDPREPEVREFAQTDESADVQKTGTTTVGIAATDGVVVATDRRASLGGRFVTSKSIVKAQQIHPRGVITLVGSVGGAQSFADNLEAEVSLYEGRRERSMDIGELATLAANFARGGPFFAIRPILGGVDDDGSHVYSLDPAGGIIEDDYTVTGSGTQVAYGVLESEHDEEMTVEEGRRAAARAIDAAAERDSGTGNGLVFATITDDGVDMETYDYFPDPDEL